MNKFFIFPKFPVPKSVKIFLCFSSSPSTLKHRHFQAPFDLPTCTAALQSCAQHSDLLKGQQLHSHMLAAGLLTSPQSLTCLLNMYSKCASVAAAVSLFHSHRHLHNVFAYNAMISGFISNNMAEYAIQYYYIMRREGVAPDKFTLPCLIKASCEVRAVSEVGKVHGVVFKLGLELDVFVGSALVNVCLKFRLMEDARKVFEEMPVRDVVLWNSMVNGFAQIGRFEEALHVFRRMGEEGVVPSRFTVTGVLSVIAVMEELNRGRIVHGFVMKMGYDSGVAVLNALIDMYGKCRRVGDALEIFEIMDEKDIFSWNSIISVHEQGGDHGGTLKLFHRMLHTGVQPDLVTVTTMLPSCAHLAALMHGREIHGYMIANGLGKDDKDIDDMLLNNAIMDMYAKCGSMRDAHLIFYKMSNKDVASWNIMIMGYGMHGYGSESLNMFTRMCEAKLKPDQVTFVGILSACSHAGFLNKGREFLGQMKSIYGVVPSIEHYTCVIDMLGRAGKLAEAYELALTMPIEANPVVWRALLGACRLHGNSDLAEVAAQRVIELDPEHCGSYVLMSNVYGIAGRYEEVSEVRHTMRQQNVRKTPGCSWIELSNGVHVFVTGDRTHPQANYIYAGLNSLTAWLREHGYVPDV